MVNHTLCIFNPLNFAVLDRVKSFLPQMEEANKQLDEKIAEGSTLDLDIENVDDCEGPIIEMVHTSSLETNIMRNINI